MPFQRRNHYDVTNRIRISHPGDVEQAVTELLARLYPRVSFLPVARAFHTFTRLYAGTLPGYVGCDTYYHDAQHSLDCALAMARLLDGHERSVAPDRQLGARRAILGILIALFHDAGYIRRSSDRARNGAEFTMTHVRRSAEFLAGFLPGVGFDDEVNLARQLVHFTGYEIALERIRVTHPKDRMLGFMLGTADILAQTADRCYLEKCRDYLFREFEICGIAGAARDGGAETRYPTVESLLRTTPEFNRHLWEDRLDGYFGSVHRYMEKHFGGRNPYTEQIHRHLKLIVRLGRRNQFDQLRKRPVCVDAAVLRAQLDHRAQRASAAPRARHTTAQLGYA